MKMSRTAIKELTAAYRAVLKRAMLASMGIAIATPTLADTVANYDGITDAINNLADSVAIDFTGNINAGDSNLIIPVGKNIVIDGAGFSYAGQDFVSGPLVKEEETTYYKFKYVNDAGETEYMYTTQQSISVGTDVWFTPDMAGEPKKINHRYGTFVGFDGQNSDIVYTRYRDGDAVNSKGIQVYAFKDADGNILYSKYETDWSPTSFFTDKSLATATRVNNIMSITPNGDGTFTFAMAGGIANATTTAVAKPYIKYSVGEKEFYVAPDTDMSADMDVSALPTLGDGTETTRLVHNSDGSVYLTQGGAIKVDSGATLALNDITIQNIYTRTKGGALHLLGKITGGENINFVSNRATSEGGAIYADKNAVVSMGDNISFVSNYTKANGGAISIYSNASVSLGDNAAFIGNSADGSLGRGGAVMLNTTSASFTVGDNAVFADNYSTKKGGAIYAYASTEAKAATVKIGENALFKNNIAYVEFGGALYLSKFAYFELGAGATFIGNQAGMMGGAIAYTSVLSDLNLDGATFAGNSAQQAGAILFGDADTEIDKNLNITGSLFSENIAVGATQEIDGVLWDMSAGGAILVNSKGTGMLTVSDSVFSGNSSTAAGGAIGQTDGSTATIEITNSDFVGNQTGAEGGAINSDAVLKITGGRFVGNQTVDTNVDEEKPLYSAGGGGAIFLYDQSNTTVTGGAEFSGNSAGTYGGAIATRINASAVKSSLTIDGAIFTGNTAGFNGGAIYNTVAMTLMGDNAFTGNTAGGVANDIHNIGTMTIASGTTTIDGGITGDGALTIADGATLNIGTTTVQQKELTLDGTVGATIIGANNYGKLLAETYKGNGKVSLNVATTGTYNIFGENANEYTVVDAGVIYDVTKGDNGAVTIATKKVEEIAKDTGLTGTAANMVAALANVDNDLANIASLNVQQALRNRDTDYIETESAKANPVDKPVVQSVAQSVQGAVMTLAANRMAGAPSEGTMGRSGGDLSDADYGVWAQGMFNKSKFNGQFNGYTRGVSAGFDALIDKQYTIGLGYAFGHSDVHANGGRDTEIDSNSIFAYAQYKPSEWFVNAALNYTMSKYNETVDAFGVRLESDYDTDAFGGQVMTGYDFASGLTPEVGLRYLHVSQDSYNNGLNHVSSDDTDFLTGIAGMKYRFAIENDSVINWFPELRAAATYDFVSDKAMSTVTMPGAASYVVDGDRLSRFGGEFGIGLTAEYNGLEISLVYDLNLHKDYTSQTGMAKFRYEF